MAKRIADKTLKNFQNCRIGVPVVSTMDVPARRRILRPLQELLVPLLQQLQDAHLYGDERSRQHCSDALSEALRKAEYYYQPRVSKLAQGLGDALAIRLEMPQLRDLKQFPHEALAKMEVLVKSNKKKDPSAKENFHWEHMTEVRVMQSRLWSLRHFQFNSDMVFQTLNECVGCFTCIIRGDEGAKISHGSQRGDPIQHYRDRDIDLIDE
jgi:hypothetical protein